MQHSDCSKDHALKNLANIKEICKSVSDKFHLSDFIYHRIFKTNKRIYLSTDENWLHYFFNKKLFEVSTFNRLSQLNGYMLWKFWPKQDKEFVKTIHDIKNHFPYGDALYVIRAQDEYVDCFCFRGKAEDEKINNVFVNNLGEVERHINYFLAKSKVIIDEGVLKLHASTENIIFDNNIEDLVDNRFFYRHQFIFDRNDVITKLSPKESECIIYLTMNLTAKEIAQKMRISPRTIEIHLQNIRTKLNCSSTSRIIIEILKLNYNASILVNYFKNFITYTGTTLTN